MAIKWPFGKKRKDYNFLGVDIGTSAVRLVELSSSGSLKKLENYSQLSLLSHQIFSQRARSHSDLLFSTKRFAEMISQMVAESKIKTLKAIFSLPDFATLFTAFNLPPMAEEEVAQAIKFEARRHVPLPLSEVTLDWLITKSQPPASKSEDMEVLLVVVPNRIIEQYAEIAKMAGLELEALEAEVFALQRALVGKSQKTCCLIDIGARSTTCTIIDGGVLRSSYSFDIAGNDLTERIMRTFNVDFLQAEQMKVNQGLLPGEKDVDRIIEPLVDSIISEVRRVSESFYERERKEVDFFTIAGAAGFMPGMNEYFAETLKKNVFLAFPFSGMEYPKVLEAELRRMGPGFSIAVGASLKGFE